MYSCEVIFDLLFIRQDDAALLENSCLFEEHIDPPGKFMSVRRTDGPSWKIHVDLYDIEMRR